jgi:glucose/arabinose dehydrogenase
LAFHPKFRENGFFYVNYTDTNGNTVIARFQAKPTANQCDNTTQYILLSVHQPYQNHNGGGMLFGVDGDLYLGLGDGGSAGDPQGNGQSLDTLLGKILRIDVNGTPPYGIPVDNPFIGKGKPEIWAYGLRNPWRFDFDPLTHDLYIGDVGQDAWEEIDFLPAGSRGGANFGWNYQEGKHAYRGNPPANQQLIDPVYEYSHAEGGCSVTGGVVYRGQALPAWQGIYVFGDYCSGKVWGLLRDASGNWQGKVLFDTNYAITSFGRDEGGEIYLVDQRGTIERLAANAS